MRLKAYEQGKLLMGVSVACALWIAPNWTAAQNATPCGVPGHARLVETVTDAETHTPLPSANIAVVWQDAGEHVVRAQTDSAGVATLCAPTGRTLTIRVTYFDYSATDQTALTLAQATQHTTRIAAPNALVRGSVVDAQSGAPVQNVSVALNNSSLSRVTDANGRFVFERVPVGDYVMRVDHIAFAAHTADLSVRDQDMDMQIRLTTEAIALQPIIVSVFSRRLEQVGFYDRQKRGVGTFINRKQIDAMNVQTGSDLLRKMPNMRLIPEGRRQGNNTRQSTHGRNNCRFRFIVDGSRTLSDFEMDFVAPGAIEGVEIYSGLAQIPAAFRPQASTDAAGAPCGVIAIWTRNSR